MTGSPRGIGLIAAFGLLQAVGGIAHAGSSPALVINEVYIDTTETCGVTPGGPEKYVEIENKSKEPVDTVNWWLCDHPFSHYWRILQVPQDNGPPAADSIILQPGDFLVVRFHGQFPPPNGDYSSQPNNSGTTTHTLRIFIPEPALGCFFRAKANFSIWDQSPPADPDFPSFDVPAAIRDFVAWGPGGHYDGWQRGCIASNPQANKWSAPIENDCTGSISPIFEAVNTDPLLSLPGYSINYNKGDANNPADYFLAPKTEGETNVMPGDLDADFDVDNDDYNAFVGCLNQPADPPLCARANFNQDAIVDCQDWPFFAANWQMYSMLPAPQSPCTPCKPGDFNNDGLVNGDDLQGSIAAFTGTASPCAADMDNNGVVDCEDVQAFARTLLTAPSDCIRGDLNFDSLVDGADIQPFITVLMTPPVCLSPAEFCVADLNSDQFITIDDLDPFVTLLLGPAK
jgi:hypothetical protein